MLRRMVTGAPSSSASIFLVVLSLALFAPGLIALPPIDRDEPHFAQATRQMLATGDYIRIRYRDRPRHKKPIGIHWLQAAAVTLVGGRDAIWPYRLPALVCATLAVVGTLSVGRLIFDEATARLGAALLAASVLLGVEARLATTDAVLLLTVVVAQLALARAWVTDARAASGRWGTSLLFWSALGVGVLVKGPITIVVVALSALALTWARRSARWLARLRPELGIPLALAIVLPWMVAIAVATNGRFFLDSVGRDLLPKLVVGQEGHSAPPGYHAALFPALFWPGSAFALLAMPWVWRHRSEPAVRFCLAWIVPTWLLLELVTTKLPHYVLPTYPAIALLSARAARELAPPLASWVGRVAFALWVAVGVALAAAVVLVPFHIGAAVRPGPIVGAVLTMAAIGVAAWYLEHRHWQRAAAAMVGAALVFSITATKLVLPELPVWLSREAQRVVTAEAARRGLADPAVASAGFAEPSLVFLLGPRTILTNGEGAASHLAHDARGLALVEGRARPSFHARLDADGIVPTPLAVIDGYNYSTGRHVSLELYGR